MGHIVLRLDRVMADRKMSLNELSKQVGVANVNLSKSGQCHPLLHLGRYLRCAELPARRHFRIRSQRRSEEGIDSKKQA